MKLPFTLTLLFISFLFISSCNKGPTGGIPFYLQMDTAVVAPPHYVSASSNSQDIKDVWVTAGSSNLGAYALPCNFPVLLYDSVFFVVSPGVWETGQSGNPVIYPLMNPDVFTMYAKSGQVYTHVPKFTYKAADTVVFNEDFELGSDYNANMVRTKDSTKYGLYCGSITVGPNDSSVTACQQVYEGRATPYPLTSGNEIWVELDYKSTVPFNFGVLPSFADGTVDTIGIVYYLPQANWTKEYIKLSELVGQEGAVSYSLYFQALNPYGFAGGSVYVDNIRLIHLQN